MANTTKHNIKCAGHLATALTPWKLRKALTNTVKFLKTKEFDAIAFRGLSGSLVAPIVALRLKKTLLAVRKDTSDSHSSYMVEGDLAAKRYVIVDDFIAGGSTVYNIMKEVHTAAPRAECVGYFGYNRQYDMAVSGWRDVSQLDDYIKQHGELIDCGRGRGDGVDSLERSGLCRAASGGYFYGTAMGQ